MSVDNLRSQFHWEAVSGVTEIPLLVASRALELSVIYVENADDITDRLYDAELRRMHDGDVAIDKLVIARGKDKQLEMTSAEDGETIVAARYRGRTYCVSTEAISAGPDAVHCIDFTRTGKGKKLDYTLEIERGYKQHNLEVCMQIADVVAKRMSEFKYLLLTGMWPKG